MTKVSIIDVDLGITIDDLIQKNVAALSQTAQNELEAAVAAAKKVKELKEKKDLEASEAQDKIDSVMNNIYQKLVDSNTEGVSLETITQLTEGTISSMSAFTLRMKKILRDKGNPFAMNKRKKNGVQYYFFDPYNENHPNDSDTQ